MKNPIYKFKTMSGHCHNRKLNHFQEVDKMKCHPNQCPYRDDCILKEVEE